MQTVTDNQMQNANDFIMGIIHAHLGIQPKSDKDEYLNAYAEEYEDGEKSSANLLF